LILIFDFEIYIIFVEEMDIPVICPINHDYGVCEICDNIREEEIREGTFRDDNVKNYILGDNLEGFRLFVENALSSKEISRDDILQDIYLSYGSALITYKGINSCLVYLLDQGLSIDVCGKDRWTPLRFAECHENIELCAFLIKRGANVNSVDYAGVSILHAAAIFENNVEIVLLLLRNGADPNLHYKPIASLNPERGGPLLYIFAEDSRSPYIDDRDWKIFQLLLEYGADPYATSYENKTAFDCMNEGNKVIFSKMIDEYWMEYPKEPES
jgi:ankyrin repeat protein